MCILDPVRNARRFAQNRVQRPFAPSCQRRDSAQKRSGSHQPLQLLRVNPPRASGGPGTAAAISSCMRRAPLVLLAVLGGQGLALGQPAQPPPTTAPTAEHDAPHRDRRLLAAGTTAGAYALLYSWVTLAWYVRTTDSNAFHFHDEGWFERDSYAGGADKMGHLWATLALARLGTEMLDQ